MPPDARRTAAGASCGAPVWQEAPTAGDNQGTQRVQMGPTRTRGRRWDPVTGPVEFGGHTPLQKAGLAAREVYG
jgi:hypothetical protein